MDKKKYYFELKKLTVGYNGKPLINDINIELHKGHILTLIGPNGAGKSTILKTIIKQLPELKGMVLIGNRNSNSLSYLELAKKVSVLLTDRIKTERMTCKEVVEAGRYPHTGRFGLLSKSDHDAVGDAMKITGTTNLADYDFMQVSDGQRQRILFARAIAQEPEMMILDEPTSFLDARYKLEMLSVLRYLAHERGITIIMTMHELDLAERISDEVMCVKGDYIYGYGNVMEMFKRDNIVKLFDIDTGSYNSIFGSLEMIRPEGKPKLFVIAGGGTGVRVFRALQRKGIPFASGVLHEGGIDAEVAKDLATETVLEKAFCYIGDAAIDKALYILRDCDSFINCLDVVGDINSRNLELIDEAKKIGLKELSYEELLR